MPDRQGAEDDQSWVVDRPSPRVPFWSTDTLLPFLQPGDEDAEPHHAPFSSVGA